MRLERFTETGSFARVARPFLERWEIEHALLLGLIAALEAGEPVGEAPAYHAVVTGEEGVELVALMTPPQQLLLSRVGTIEALSPLTADLLASEWRVPGVLGPPEGARQFTQLWSAASHQAYAIAMEERLFVLERVQPVTGVPGMMCWATAVDRPWLVDWLTRFVVEAQKTLAAEARERAERMADRRLREDGKERAGYCVWIDGQPVALAGYGGATPQGIIRIGPVFTPLEFRRRGYATALTAALSQWLLDVGYRFCTLYTDLANPTSNKIYQRVGYRPVCDVTAIRFGTSETGR